jgi:hypothetical protein
MFQTINDFSADKFTPTTWEDAKQKARFAKTFIRFVEADFPRRQWTTAFHRRLSQTFGHAAHLDRLDFFDTFFASLEGKARFLGQCLAWPCHGDPQFTYSDVAKAIQSWLLQNGVLAKYEQRLAEQAEAAEGAELAGCKATCGPAATGDSVTEPGLRDDIKTAYETHRLRPIRRCFFLRGKRYDSAWPLVALAIHRGEVDRDDPAIARDAADNPAVEWAARTFGEEWSWGICDGFDRQTLRIDDPDYRDGYDLGVALAQEILPGS